MSLPFLASAVLPGDRGTIRGCPGVLTDLSFGVSCGFWLGVLFFLGALRRFDMKREFYIDLGLRHAALGLPPRGECFSALSTGLSNSVFSTPRTAFMICLKRSNSAVFSRSFGGGCSAPLLCLLWCSPISHARLPSSLTAYRRVAPAPSPWATPWLKYKHCGSETGDHVDAQFGAQPAKHGNNIPL